jgi:hypothetical protein
MIEAHREVPPEPKMKDNMFDTPESKRGLQGEALYHNQNADVVNPTIFPDRLWKTFAPVITIRHPAKQVGSYYKASRISAGSIDSSEFELSLHYKFSRMLFDYFRKLYQNRQYRLSKGSGAPNSELQWPIVIDGDDLINDTEGLAQRFCAITHLNPVGVIYEWGRIEKADPFDKAFFGTLDKSVGVVKNEVSLGNWRPSGHHSPFPLNQTPEIPSVAKESKKWEQTWGPKVTQRLVHFAEKIMPDYEYLYQFRL